MPRGFFVHVSAASARNYNRGTDRLVWGWKDRPLEYHNHAHGSVTNREIAATITPGDYLVFGHRGPDPRGLGVDEYAAGVFQEVTIFRARTGLYHSASPVWDDDIYPNRVRLEFFERGERWGVEKLGRDGMLALRDSANAHAVPVPVSSPLFAFQRRLLDQHFVDYIDPSDTEDAYSWAVRRREQSKLRLTKLMGRESTNCDLCGLFLPAEFLRAAHIKRRADCSPIERSDASNVLLACLLGCDALFETGYLGIRADGQLCKVRHSPVTLAAQIERLVGRVITDDPRVLRYAAAHRARHAS